MQKPNILFLFPDQHRGDWMPWKEGEFPIDGIPKIIMPHLRKLMDEGITFTNAWTPSPLCAPARACLAAGRRYDQCQVPSNQYNYPDDMATFYQSLRDDNWQVGGVGKFDLDKNSYAWGKDGFDDKVRHWGFTCGCDNAGKIDAVVADDGNAADPYMYYLQDEDLMEVHVADFTKRRSGIDCKPTLLPEKAYCDNWISQNGIDLIRNFPEDRPWFMQVNFTGPHSPFDVTERMFNDWKDVDMPMPSEHSQDDDTVLCKRKNYAAMLENIDRNIGLMLKEIEKRGELDNTIVIYSSDHGEMLGDKGKYGKCQPWQASVNIPMVIWGKGIDGGRISSALVELNDITATILDYAGLPMLPDMDSISLRDAAEGSSDKVRDYTVSSLIDNRWNWRTVSDGEWKLVVYDDGEMLFNTIKDRWETKNVIDEYPEIRDRLFDNMK